MHPARSSGRSSRLLLALVCTTTIWFSACESSFQPDTDEDTTTSLDASAAKWRRDPLDSALYRTMADRAPNGGVSFFRLPLSHQLGRIPQDPKNRLTRAKIALGRLLYHETALAVNNVRAEGSETYSCASCHHAQGGFAANLPQGMGEGGSGFGVAGESRTVAGGYDSSPDTPDCQPTRTPSTLNCAYQPLMLWNGQFGAVGDNRGTEALWTPGTPLESNFLGHHGVETQAHAGLSVHRMGSIEVSRVISIPEYAELFRRAFPGQREPVSRLNAALAIAAYERTLLATQAPLQRWLRGETKAMSEAQKRGAILFFGRAGCVRCHTGPALNSMSFHALGMHDFDRSIDPGRVDLRPFGDTVPARARLGRGGFTQRPEDMYAFKVPQLYNLVDSPFYGHGASFGSVRAVVEYLNAAVAENPLVPAERLSPAFAPLGLTPAEIDDLVAFLEEGLYDSDLDRYVPAWLPSGNCFPNNDPQSRLDLGWDDLVWGVR